MSPRCFRFSPTVPGAGMFDQTMPSKLAFRLTHRGEIVDSGLHRFLRPRQRIAPRLEHRHVETHERGTCSCFRARHRIHQSGFVK